MIYILLQPFNKIKASLQKLLTENQYQDTNKKRSRKRAITQPKFGRWLPISNLTCILQWYKVLQSLNEINVSLQKLLSGNEQQKLCRKMAITQPKFADDNQYRTWPVFYSDIKFCKVWMKSIPPFKSYWVETKSVTTTTTKPPPRTTRRCGRTTWSLCVRHATQATQ